VSEKDLHYEQIKELFTEYYQNYEEFIADKQNVEIITESMMEYIQKTTTGWMQEKVVQIYSESDWQQLKDEVKSKRASLLGQYGLDNKSYPEIDDFNDAALHSIINRNLHRRAEKGNSPLVNTQMYHSAQDEDIVKEIEILFTGDYDAGFVSTKAEQIYLPF
jgi:hypothetical protein